MDRPKGTCPGVCGTRAAVWDCRWGAGGAGRGQDQGRMRCRRRGSPAAWLMKGLQPRPGNRGFAGSPVAPRSLQTLPCAMHEVGARATATPAGASDPASHRRRAGPSPALERRPPCAATRKGRGVLQTKGQKNSENGKHKGA